ncbi:MAG TPA: CHAP domain-containing protein [Spirochaetia bacterium]|nr:CHAP domain-containing protein [Spirochaetia bacterium]
MALVLRCRRYALAAPLIVLGVSAMLGSCASFQGNGPSYWHPIANPYPATGPAAHTPPIWSAPAPQRATEDPSVAALRNKLVQGAAAVLGRNELVIRGRRFTMDCTGTVLAIYWYAGIDLSQDFGNLRGTGVSRIYQTLQRRNLLYTTTHPLSGDIIFWDDTYDEGYEGQPNPLSHMGMVVSVDREGTIAYVHYHIRRGITIDYMNLESPDVQSRMENGSMKVINSPMRLAVPGRPHPARWLAGQLYRVMGLGYLLE